MHKQANVIKEWKNQHGEIEKLTPYDATQRMRRMENTMRKTRSRAAAFKESDGMEKEYKEQKARYGNQIKEYKKFCEAMGLKPQMERVYADGLGRIGTAKGTDTSQTSTPTSRRSGGSKWNGGERTAAEVGKSAAMIPKHDVKTFDIDVPGDIEKILKIKR